MPEQVNEYDREGEEGEEEGNSHIGGHIKAAFCCGRGIPNDDRMDGTEQSDNHECDRRTDTAQQRIDCAEAGAAFRVFDALTKHEIRDVDELSDGRGGETWI